MFYNTEKRKDGQHLLDYRCCPLKICFDPFSDRMKESNFLALFVGCALLRLFKILAGRVHIEFNFPKLLRILPDDLNWAWVSACSCSNLASVIFGMKNHGYPSLY